MKAEDQLKRSARRPPELRALDPAVEPRASDHPSAELKRLGLKARRGLSQNFLQDQGIARAIVASASLDDTVDVLEVGPGLGVLTKILVKEARRVVAVELDDSLASRLEEAVGAANLVVQHQDILKFEPANAFTEPFVVVANLPYHITSPAIRHLLQTGPPRASRLIVMVQKEVAERIVAKQGDLSALAVSIQAQAAAKIVRRVPAKAFYPAPKVDSAVLLIEPLAEPPVGLEDAEEFLAFLHAGFTQPRKTLGNSLGQGLGERARAVAMLEAVGIDPQRRPQQLSVAEWVTLFAGSRAGG